MQTLTTIKQLQEFRKSLVGSVGFVPTMGALHNGHKSLIDSSIKQNDFTMVSIFVNPTQFAPNEDLDKYPRSVTQDLQMCEDCGVSAVFLPESTQLYSDDEITLNPPKLMGYVLEGFIRPSHFSGVLQVVLKLLNLTMPHNAYFGRKDAQQVLIIKQLARQFFLSTNIIDCPIVRDSDGLALSSRNIYLSSTERQNALSLSKSIKAVELSVKNGLDDTKKLRDIALQELKNVQIEYANFFNHKLEPQTRIQNGNSIFLVAAKVGNTRLLDNAWL